VPPQLPWPCWFTLSAFRPSGRLSRCATCLDGARRCSGEGSVPVSSPSAISPPGSSHSSFPARWRCRSCLLLAVAGGARPHGGWRPSAIAQLQGFSSCSRAAVSHQWSSTRMTTSLVMERSEPGCGLPLPSASRMFISLAGVEGEPSWGPAVCMGWRPASSSSVRRKRRQTSATWCWPARKCHQPSSFQPLGLDGLVLTPVGGRERGPLRHGACVEVVAAAGEPLASCWCRGGR
jgi:hypothetical protein